jgi:uncharacterized protein YdhG (YjbR/CyaY superfamily)
MAKNNRGAKSGKSAKKPAAKKEDGEGAVLAQIGAMTGTDRAIGEKIHAIVRANAPGLTPKLWYGMPAYANEDGKVVCFFQSAQKFKTRYATLGFMHESRLDDGAMWPVAFAVTAVTAREEERIGAMVRKAVS